MSDSPETPRSGGRARYRRVYSRVGNGVFLVCVGAVLLLNTTGRIGYDVWLDLIQLWPLLLISLGIRLIFLKTAAHPLCLLGPALLVTGVIVVVVSHEREASEWERLDDAPQLALDCKPFMGDPEEGSAEPRPARLDVRFGSGALRLSTPPIPPGPGDAREDAGWFAGTVRYRGDEPRRICSERGSLRLSGGEIALGSINLIAPFRVGRNRWDASVSSPDPIDLRLKIAGARADLDLAGLRVRDLVLESAVSQVTLRLGTPQGRVPVRVDGAVSTLALELPEGVCYDIRARGPGTLRLESRTWSFGSRRRTSGDCGEAETDGASRYEITVDLPLSAVSVDRVGAVTTRLPSTAPPLSG